MALVTARASGIEALDPCPSTVEVVTPAPFQPGRGLKVRGTLPTHPGCRDCCARRLCHWCLRPPFEAQHYTLRQWERDGFWYGACEQHARDLHAALDGDLAPNAVATGMGL